MSARARCVIVTAVKTSAVTTVTRPPPPPILLLVCSVVFRHDRLELEIKFVPLHGRRLHWAEFP